MATAEFRRRRNRATEESDGPASDGVSDYAPHGIMVPFAPYLALGDAMAERSKALRSGRSLLCGRRFESCPVHHFDLHINGTASVAQLVERSAVNR